MGFIFFNITVVRYYRHIRPKLGDFGQQGNLADSVLGATLERKGLMGNNVVNFFNTGVGAVVCWLLV